MTASGEDLAGRVAPAVTGRAFAVGSYDGGVDSYWTAVIWSLLPTVVVCVVFWFVLRSILRFDRTERRVYATIEAEERAKRGLPPRES